MVNSRAATITNRNTFRIMCSLFSPRVGARTHRQRTLERMREEKKVILVLHDTTELDYTGLRSIPTWGLWAAAVAATVVTCAITVWPSILSGVRF